MKNHAEVSDDGKYWVMPPEMMITAGNRSRGAATATPDLSLAPSTRVNFFISVDINCSERDRWEDEFEESRYDYVHHALEEGSQAMSDLEEGIYAMIDESEINDQAWRIAFEDLEWFSDAQMSDVKANGYGGSWSNSNQTYGGDGWTYEGPQGFRRLEELDHLADYSDMVMLLTLVPCDGPCE